MVGVGCDPRDVRLRRYLKMYATIIFILKSEYMADFLSVIVTRDTHQGPSARYFETGVQRSRIRR